MNNLSYEIVQNFSVSMEVINLINNLLCYLFKLNTIACKFGTTYF